MANELAEFRAHARRMERALHKPGCPGWVQTTDRIRDGSFRREACRGCVTDSERAEWKRLADEVDAYRGWAPTTT